MPRCEGISYKHHVFAPIYWSKYRGMNDKLINLGNFTLVDLGPHGKFLNNCTDDVKTTVCDYMTDEIWNSADTTIHHHHRLRHGLA